VELGLFSKKKENQPQQPPSSVQSSSQQKPVFSLEGDKPPAQLPDFTDVSKVDVRYPLLAPYALVHIYWDAPSHELVYEVEEPQLSSEEKEMLSTLEDGIRELINISFVNIKDETIIISYLEKNLQVLLSEFHLRIKKETFLKFMYYMYRDFVGLNEIEPLMHDYYIEDIECNGSQTPLYIIHRKYQNLRTNIVFPSNQPLASFVEKLAQKTGKYVSYATPLLDGRLPDGSRVNAVYSSDVSSRGPTFTIRKFSREPWTPIKLVDFRTVSPEILAYLWILIENGTNIMVVGGTGSGKTSFLNAIAFFIPPAARIVSIEDTKELQLEHENWLPSIAREGIGLASSTGQKRGEVTLFDLLRESFRQRPDYVIVGEIRGKEAFVLIQGASSGHPSFATMHAESVESMVRRLMTEPINLSPALVESIDAVCVLVHAKVGGKDVRRIRDISEIIKVYPDGQVKTNVPFVRDPRSDKFYFRTGSYVFQKVVTQQGINLQELNLEFSRRAKLLFKLYEQKIFGFSEVQQVIHQYYKSSKEVLSRFGIS